MAASARRPYRHPWPVAQPDEEEDAFAHLDEEKVKEIEATRPVDAAQLVAEAYQAMGVLPEWRQNETEEEEAERYAAEGEIGRDPSSYVPADFGARGLVRNRLCGGSRRLYAILNGCCCCLGCGRCAARDISDTFSRLAPIEPANDDDEDEEEETVLSPIS